MRELSSVEDKVKVVWKNLLQADEINPDQTFFELGGDSITMIDMIAQLSAELETEIDPALLFSDATFCGFSKSVYLALEGSPASVHG